MKMAELLVDQGADVRRPGQEGDTPLMVAARNGCLTMIEWLIERGADVGDFSEFDGSTALTVAVISGNLEIVDYLINKGASLRTENLWDSRSLLSVAAAQGFLAEVRYFLEKGFPVNGRDDSGLTAIHYSLRSTITSRYILEYLVDHGGDPTIKNNLGISPLMDACLHGLPWHAGYLIGKGTAVNDSDLNKETPLHYACRGIPAESLPESEKRPLATIKLLIEKGARVNVQDIRGRTPLMDAARNAGPQAVEVLLDRGAQIDGQDLAGMSALMHAADWNQTAVIKILAERGADLNLKNAKGETALAIAKQKRSSAPAYELLKSLGAN